MNVRDIALYFLKNEKISKLKLQKLLYYSQGFHLAIFDKQLFSEPIEKWINSPVVQSIWYYYDNLQSDNFDCDIIDNVTKDLLNEVYGQFANWKLRDMIFVEPPFIICDIGDQISLHEMQKYFKTLLVR